MKKVVLGLFLVLAATIGFSAEARADTVTVTWSSGVSFAQAIVPRTSSKVPGPIPTRSEGPLPSSSTREVVRAVRTPPAR